MALDHLDFDVSISSCAHLANACIIFESQTAIASEKSIVLPFCHLIVNLIRFGRGLLRHYTGQKLAHLALFTDQKSK